MKVPPTKPLIACVLGHKYCVADADGRVRAEVNTLMSALGCIADGFGSYVWERVPTRSTLHGYTLKLVR